MRASVDCDCVVATRSPSTSESSEGETHHPQPMRSTSVHAVAVVVTTGTAAARASPATRPKFSERDGNTKRSVPSQKVSLSAAEIGGSKRIRSSIRNVRIRFASDCFVRESLGPTRFSTHPRGLSIAHASMSSSVPLSGIMRPRNDATLSLSRPPIRFRTLASGTPHGTCVDASCGSRHAKSAASLREVTCTASAVLKWRRTHAFQANCFTSALFCNASRIIMPCGEITTRDSLESAASAAAMIAGAHTPWR